MFLICCRISNCSTDASHKQVFSFISTNTDETTECHAFLCSKRKLAETVTLAVARAFSTAYEAWRVLPSTQQFGKTSTEIENFKNTINTVSVEIVQEKPSPQQKPSPEEKLIDFEEDLSDGDMSPSITLGKLCDRSGNSHWVRDAYFANSAIKALPWNFTNTKNNFRSSYFVSTQTINYYCFCFKVSFDDDFAAELNPWNTPNKIDLILA